MDIRPANSVYRETTTTTAATTAAALNNAKPKLPIENPLLATPGVRRPSRATSAVATAGVQRRRVIKKHIQQKYLLCGFAIHAFLATPAYLYGNIVESDKDLVLRIWPAIVYQATGQLCRALLQEESDYRGSSNETVEYRRLFLCATLLTCFSLMISGVFFTSAWFTVSTTTQAIAILLYGFFAGIGCSLFIWKTHVILEAVRPREDKFVRKTIHLCGEAFCQLFLSFVFTSLRTLYGTAQSIVLMSALLVNLIPISLIITRHREGAITKRISVIKAESGFTPLHHQLGRFSNSFTDHLDGIELQIPRTWKNPIMEHNAAAVLVAAAAAVDSQHNYMLATDEAYVTFVNPNGVEIMEIIPEEDETVSMMRSSTGTIENYGKISSGSVNTSQTIHKSNVSNEVQLKNNSFRNLNKFQQFSKDVSSQLWHNLLDKLLAPLKTALLVPKLYTTTLLLSADIFSYVMCLTVLPGLAISHHALKNAEIPFLFSLLAFPWMCFSLMTPRFGNSLYKRKFQWHTLGCLCKGIALIFISFSTSKLLLSVMSVLLGFGQAITLFLQDVVLQLGMSRTQWTVIRSPMHFTNGLLILLWGAMAHLVVVRYSFQASVGLAAIIYVGAILLWNLVYLLCDNKQ